MMKKNPFMSMWMSGVNSAVGAARGSYMSELHRQQRAMTQRMIRFWTGAWTSSTSRSGNDKSRSAKRR
jgi:hypothetical protein